MIRKGAVSRPSPAHACALVGAPPQQPCVLHRAAHRALLTSAWPGGQLSGARVSGCTQAFLALGPGPHSEARRCQQAPAPSRSRGCGQEEAPTAPSIPHRTQESERDRNLPGVPQQGRGRTGTSIQDSGALFSVSSFRRHRFRPSDKKQT